MNAGFRLQEKALRILRAAEHARKNGELDRASRLETASAQYLDDAAVVEAAEKRSHKKQVTPTDHSRGSVVNFAAAKRSIMMRRKSRG